MTSKDIQEFKLLLAQKARQPCDLTPADVMFSQAMALIEIAYQLAVMNEKER